MKVKKAWAIAAGSQSAAELSAGAATLGEESTVVYIGEDLPQIFADSVYHFCADGTSFVQALPKLTELAAAQQPDIVLADTSWNGRLAAACVAACLGTCVMNDVSSVELCGDGVRTKRLVYGGKGIKTELRKGCAVICAGSNVFAGNNNGKAECSAAAVDVRCDDVELVSSEKKEVHSINLSAAKRVIGVGRGLKEEQNLAYINKLSEQLGAEIACTRPVTEEMKWYPRERYIGVSGITIKPELYIAVGISGQIQHTIGVTEAGTVLAINRDKDAPIFSQCDIGIVGDACEVLNAISSKLEE